MTKDDDLKFLKIQTWILRVSIHCDGCKHKVKKLLRRIEGVFQVIVDAEHQKVTVTGNVDSAALIKKLLRAGKHAELLSANKNNQTQKQKGNSNDNSKSQKQGTVKKLEIKNQQRVPSVRSEEDEDYFDEDDDEEEVDEEEEIKLFREQFSQLGQLNQQVGLLKQQAVDLSKQSGGAQGANNGGKKGNPNQNMGGAKVNDNLGGAAALRMNHQSPLIIGDNDINALMGIAGSGVGYPNGMGAFQVNPNSGFHTGGHGHASAAMMMNRHGMMQQQPQMMYHRSSPMAHPNSSYYYNYAPPLPLPGTYSGQSASSSSSSSSSSSNMYNDDNTVGCSVM